MADEEIEELSGEASAEDIEEIDQILEEADPEFVNQLKNIKAENLNNQEIGLPPAAEQEKHEKWYNKFWYSLDRKRQMFVLLGGFTLFVAVPILLMSYFGILTPQFLVARQTSLEKWADKTVVLEAGKPQKDLMHLFLSDQYFLEVPEQVYALKPKAGIHVARFAFYMELMDRNDVKYFEGHYEEILEILSRILKQHTFEDFRGIEGKEEMRKILLASINGRLSTQIRNIRYKLVVF